MDQEKAAVYGEVYNSANSQVAVRTQAIYNNVDQGFESEEECERWAHDHFLDIMVYSGTRNACLYVSHKGDIITASTYKHGYGNVLYVKYIDKHGILQKLQWIPTGFKYLDNARINGEKSDGIREPLYHRDYFQPTGYYDENRGTMNIAKTSPIFAKETGRDTSHIYTFIKAISGECYLYLLAWLRAKMINPTVKTQVVPIIVSKTQGNGKTTFAEVICKGLFGADNVLVTDQYDSNSRFNADYADALIVCHEEKEYEDKRNSTASLKSRATATTIRKERKGLDPIYQESYTDFIMTSNKDVPIKFEDDTDQRRFMVMEADPNFTRANPIADEVFTKLYGMDIDQIYRGTPFIEDKDLISQFKHELYTSEEIKNIQYKKFPHTAAYEKCFTLPRTTEAVEIEGILRSIAPFIRDSLLQEKLVTTTLMDDETIELSHYVNNPHLMYYIPATKDGTPAFVALCRPLVFYDQSTGKPFTHSTVERVIYDCNKWLKRDFNIQVHPDMTPLIGGFPHLKSVYRSAPAARFVLSVDIKPRDYSAGERHPRETTSKVEQRIGERLRVNDRWQPDPTGAYETVNEMKPGTTTLADKNKNVQYMDTFLFEADETTKTIYMLEEARLQQGVDKADRVFQERLRAQLFEAKRLFTEGIVARVVYSGGKSYHLLVRVRNTPQSLEEYKWLHAYLAQTITNKLIFDATTADPARLTRAPITRERTFEYHGKTLSGTQKLVFEDWYHIYDLEWRVLYQQWLDRPMAAYEKNRRLVPTKPEYKEAMIDLLSGKFWTEVKWNGRRQQCFFPAYRLCRYLGYTHDTLWSTDGILDGLDSYYKKNEIGYWKSRCDSDIIKQIDKEYEDD